MPFLGLDWKQQGDVWRCHLQAADNQPKIELRQVSRSDFLLLDTFAYVVPDEDVDEGKVYVVPGCDGPGARPSGDEFDHEGRTVVVPPNPKGGRTDLASVPWFMWWLVATYGNHTRAVLLHDALIPDPGVAPPVERKAADRLLLVALKEREPEPDAHGRRKKGVFRHWLMWAAVAVFGTMGRLPAALFCAHVYAVWGLAIGGAAWAWGDLLWPDGRLGFWFVPSWAVQALVFAAGILLALSLLLLLLGGAWRAGVNNTGGWAVVLVVVGALIGVLLWLARPSTIALEWSPFTLLALALGLHVVGLLWGLVAAHRELWRWLWPTALVGLPIAALPVGLIFVSVYLVGLVDVGAAFTRALQTDDKTGERYRLDLPDVKPTQFPI